MKFIYGSVGLYAGYRLAMSINLWFAFNPYLTLTHPLQLFTHLALTVFFVFLALKD